MVKFIFDLDGTVTSEETLPVIAKHFQIEGELEELTKETVKGNIPFIESFIKRVNILGRFPVSEIDDILSRISLYPRIHNFIQENVDKCIIATGNLDVWIAKLGKKIGCEIYSSSGTVKDDRVNKLTYILKKEEIVSKYQEQGHDVIFIGEGNNDVDAMRKADVSIAIGLTHYPARSVLTIADYLIFDEETLCQQLNQLL